MICCKHSTSLSPRSQPYWHLCVVPVTMFRILMIELTAPSALLPHANNEAGVCSPQTQGTSQPLRCLPVCGFNITIADLSSCERRVAICPAADTLHYLPVCDLCPIWGSASSRCPLFCPCSEFFRGCSLDRSRMLTTGFTFSGRSEVLAEGHSSGDWEALRSFAFLHDVRCFYLLVT